MANVYVTSDHHFCSDGIIDYCQRSWPSSREMNSGLIERWNDTVDSGDHVYHLGDFVFGSKATMQSILGRLNGSIHFVLGNHDNHSVSFYEEQFESVHKRLELKCSAYSHLKDRYPRTVVVMSHYPMMSWNKKRYGSVHLHGHTHSPHLQDDPRVRRFHVGIDSHMDYRPYLLDDLLDAAASVNS